MSMSRDEIRSELVDILIATDDNSRDKAQSANDDTELFTELGLNSVGMLYMVIAIEETFGIEFEGVGVADFTTLGDVISYIEERL